MCVRDELLIKSFRACGPCLLFYTCVGGLLLLGKLFLSRCYRFGMTTAAALVCARVGPIRSGSDVLVAILLLLSKTILLLRE